MRDTQSTSPRRRPIAPWVAGSATLGLLVSLLAWVPTTSAQEAQTHTVTPDADSYVRQDRPTKNFGSGTKLRVAGSPTTRSYLRFELPDIGSDHIDSAILRLRSTTTTSDGGSVESVTDDTWQEQGLTWNNAPAAATGPVAPIGATKQGQWVQVDVTSLIGQDRLPSLRISSAAATAAVYISREGSSSLRPQLVVTTSPPADITKPTTAITSPADGSEVSGVVAVSVDASDNAVVDRVEVSLDGASIGEDRSPPYVVSFQSGGVPNGSHVLTAVAVDPSGNVGLSPSVSIVVNNAPDQEPPSRPTGLVAQAMSDSKVDLSWLPATDNVGVYSYSVLRDGVAVGTSATTGYSDVMLAPETTYEYSVTAVDGAGNYSDASEVVPVTTNAVTNSFVFAAAGDHGDGAMTSASLAALDASSAEFYLALGDMDYNQVDADATWCQFVKDRLPTKGAQFPFELVSGNHEQDGASDSYILNLTDCLPDQLNSTVAPGSVFGAEYYFDYPATDPLMRVVMLPANLTVQGSKYLYAAGSPHRDWLVSAIAQARVDGIPWITVGTHYQCLTTGNLRGCTMTKPLWNLLVDQGVDLVLNGHEHNYQRSKQLALNPSTCPVITPNEYTSGCIVDNEATASTRKASELST